MSWFDDGFEPPLTNNEKGLLQGKITDIVTLVDLLVISGRRANEAFVDVCKKLLGRSSSQDAEGV